MRMICGLFVAALVGACGESGADQADLAAAPATTSGTFASATDGRAAADGTPSLVAATADGRAETEVYDGRQMQNIAGAPQPAVSPAIGAPAGGSTAMARLPLRLGFYVASDVSCAGASNATLLLLHRDGINTSRVPCDFERVEQVDAGRYSVTTRCVEGGAAWGTEEQVDISTSTYEILDETSFRTISEDGWETTARHCAQSSLPEPWRDNDISDILGE